VTDSSGGVVPGAQVAAREETTNITTSVSSEEDGHFIFLYLSPGTYDISVRKDGFDRAEIQHVEVRVGTTSSVRPLLKIGNVSVTVSVNADAPLVDPTQSALSSVVDKRSIESLPLNGRNFTDFVLLTPGATTDGDFGMVSFNGMAGNFNNYMVDGANNNNAFFQQQIGRTSIPFQLAKMSSRNSRYPARATKLSSARQEGVWSIPSRKAEVTPFTEMATTTFWIPH